MVSDVTHFYMCITPAKRVIRAEVLSVNEALILSSSYSALQLSEEHKIIGLLLPTGIHG